MNTLAKSQELSAKEKNWNLFDKQILSKSLWFSEGLCCPDQVPVPIVSGAGQVETDGGTGALCVPGASLGQVCL